jgi:DNA repair photolyase
MNQPPRGRGALSAPPGRFDRTHVEGVDDGWRLPGDDDALPRLLETVLLPERARTIITRNESPDIPFEQSINPYRGCEHGCPYCYARPSHNYVGLSPGLDFETRLFYKVDAVALLRSELSRPGYRCRPIMLGANTDPYQPVERQQRITRGLLELLNECGHPVAVVTKGALIERDIDLLASLAQRRLVRVTLSIPTLDPALKRILEPRAASIAARLRILAALRTRGVPCGVFVAPVIPALNDHELEAVLEAVAAAGATRANYVPLRLPYEVATLFEEWLRRHYPERANRVLSQLRTLRGGALNDPCFGSRMRGQGPWAELLRMRFAIACRKLGLSPDRALELDTSQFRAPRPPGWPQQLDLLDAAR